MALLSIDTFQSLWEQEMKGDIRLSCQFFHFVWLRRGCWGCEALSDSFINPIHAVRGRWDFSFLACADRSFRFKIGAGRQGLRLRCSLQIIVLHKQSAGRKGDQIKIGWLAPRLLQVCVRSCFDDMLKTQPRRPDKERLPFVETLEAWAGCRRVC